MKVQDAKSAKSVKAKFVVEDLSCEGCAMKLATVLYGMSGARAITINPETKEVEVTYDPTLLNQKKIASTIQRAGFRIKDVKK